MSALIIWMTQQEARIFHVTANAIHGERVHQTNEEIFFRQLTAELIKSVSKQWLLMGPDLTPENFYQFLKSHHHPLSQKVIAVEKVDPMPDSEILSVGRSYLHRYYMFKGAN